MKNKTREIDEIFADKFEGSFWDEQDIIDLNMSINFSLMNIDEENECSEILIHRIINTFCYVLSNVIIDYKTQYQTGLITLDEIRENTKYCIKNYFEGSERIFDLSDAINELLLILRRESINELMYPLIKLSTVIAFTINEYYQNNFKASKKAPESATSEALTIK